MDEISSVHGDGDDTPSGGPSAAATGDHGGPLAQQDTPVVEVLLSPFQPLSGLHVHLTSFRHTKWDARKTAQDQDWTQVLLYNANARLNY